MTQQNRTESPEIDQIPRGNLAYNNNSISNHSNIDYLKNCIKINDYQNNAFKKLSFLKQKVYL